jgi:signal transduction histidine kinase
LLDRFVIPFIQKKFFENMSWDVSLSLSESLILLGLILVEILLTAITNIMPVVVQNGIKILIQQLEDLVKQEIPTLDKNVFYMEMENIEMFLLLLIIFVVIVIILTPLMIAAFWFSRIVMDEVRRIEQNKEEMQRDYEKKRNLMLSDIAHDLRTPITTISGYAKALNDGMVIDQDKQREYLEAIENKSERMSDLINLLFDYIRMDSTGYSLKKEQVNLPELLRENAALLYSDLEEKQMDLEVCIPEEICMLELDSIQFSRVITNLINNAIRHNKPGTKITLEMVHEAETIRIIVSDNGTDIEDEIAEYIFDPFIVGDASRKSKGGSGLGLSIVKKIVDLHGWNVELKRNQPEYKKAFIITICL